MLLAFLLLSLAVAQCPSSVSDELELIAQPLQCFRQLYDHKIFDNHRIQRLVTERLHSYQRMLQELSMSDKEHLQTTPVVKWAQNNGQIFISFKLSHRQDSPTCSDVRSQSFETQDIPETSGDISFETRTSQSANISGFSYRGQCFFTTQKFLFTLNIRFEATLSKLTLRKEGLGLYTLIGDKSSHSIWVNPFTDHKQAAIWAEMRNKHSNDMDKYFEQAQALAQTNKEGKRKRRRRPKSSGEGDQ